MSFLTKIQACNRFDASQFFDFVVENQRVGFIAKNKADTLLEYKNIFNFSNEKIVLNPDLNTYEKRTKTIKEVVFLLQEKKLISAWGDEYYSVSSRFNQPPYFSIPRCAAVFFGIKTYGTHLNGYTRKDGKIWVWIAKRALHLKFLPGKFDNLAAGGLPAGISPDQNMVKEAQEEAQLPSELIHKMQPKSAVSYVLETKEGACPDTMFIYDLELPPETIPTPNKEEVEDFMLYPIEELYKAVNDLDNFKYNAELVMIDFLIRHSAITPQNKDYFEIVQQLRQPKLL